MPAIAFLKNSHVMRAPTIVSESRNRCGCPDGYTHSWEPQVLRGAQHGDVFQSELLCRRALVFPNKGPIRTPQPPNVRSSECMCFKHANRANSLPYSTPRIQLPLRFMLTS